MGSIPTPVVAAAPWAERAERALNRTLQGSNGVFFHLNPSERMAVIALLAPIATGGDMLAEVYPPPPPPAPKKFIIEHPVPNVEVRTPVQEGN